MSAYLPHATCYLWDPWLIAFMVVGDLSIAVPYHVIPFFLLRSALRRRREGKTYLLRSGFAVFIVACGWTHIVKTLMIWWPRYWVEVAVIWACVFVSLGTMFYLLGTRRLPLLQGLDRLEEMADRLAPDDAGRG